jgi:hypothetical protein
MRVDRLLGEKGIPRDSEAGRRQFAALSEKRRAEESAANYEQLRRDWVLGSEEFRQELLAAATERVGPNQYGSERHETGLQKAERIVREELGRMSWSEQELRGRPKGHPGKVVIARRLRQETIMGLKLIPSGYSRSSAKDRKAQWTFVGMSLQ